MTNLADLKAFRAASEDEDSLIVLGATTAAQFRAAAALAGLIREHAHVDGYEHDEPMQAYIVQREDEQQQMVWDCEANADTPGAQLGMVAITYWAEADTFDKEADPAAQSIEALALSLNRVLHPAVHREYLGALQNLRAGTALETQQQDCSRGHPHEDMTPGCELRTEIAPLANELARATADLKDFAVCAAEQKLRANQMSEQRAMQVKMHAQTAELLAAAQQGAPAFFTVFGNVDGQAVPLAQYSAPTENGVIERIMQAAVKEGYTGYWQDRLAELGWVIRPVYAHPTTQGLDAVRELIAMHSKELERNPYAYFELAHTRQTGWCAWITDHPRSMPHAPVVNPDRKVLASGQGDTPDKACAAALAAQAKQGGE